MANSGVIGKRSRDGQGRIKLSEQFVQRQYPVPSITGFSVDGLDDTALDPAGGQTVVIHGSNFEVGATVLVGGNTIGAVTYVDSTRLTFTSEAKSSGTYNLFVVNPNGGTAILTPGLIYSGLPTFTTSAGSLGSYYETTAVSEVIQAQEDTDTITYAISSGSLPPGVTLASNGILTGTAPVENSSTTYTFTVEATDEEQQSSTRQFSLTINADVVTWVSSLEGPVSLDGGEAMRALNLSATSAAGYNVDYAVDVLPTGVTLTNGQVTGTPTTQETVASTFTATAATTGRTSTRTVTFVINFGDVYFKDTSLLLAVDTNTFITDVSGNQVTLNPQGDTRPSAFSPYNSRYSHKFGSSYYTLQDNGSFDFSGDFCIEYWAYTLGNGGGGGGTAAVIGGNNDTGSWFIMHVTDTIDVYNNGNTIINQYNTGSVKSNQWQHVALTRSGSALRLFVDGILRSSVTYSTLISVDGSTLWIGAQNNGVGYYDGYLSDIRVVKGSAVYTANFNVPTEPLTAISGTVLLLSNVDPCARDSSPNNFALTRTGNPVITSFSPYANSYRQTPASHSAAFDGNGDFVTITANSALDFGTGDFTFETWIFIPPGGSGAGQLLTLQPTSGSNFFQWFIGNSNGGTSWGINNVGNFGTSGAIPIGTWSHLALTREGNTLRQFTNGSKTYENTNFTYTIGSSNRNAFIGRDTGAYNNYLDAVLSNFRIVKGTALYTANFTAPTEPLSSITNTSLLAFQTSTLIDNSSNSLTLSGSGNVQPIAANPFGYTNVEITDTTGSAYFDGTGNYISGPTNIPALRLGSSDFTFETWAYFNTSAATKSIFVIGTNGSPNAGAGFYTDSSSRLQFLASAGGVGWDGPNFSFTGLTVPINQWVHLAWVRSGNTYYGFINGALAGTNTNSSSIFWNTNMPFYINANPYDLSQQSNAYFSNMRLVVGTALYTSSFLPPNQALSNITNTRMLTLQNRIGYNNSQPIDESGVKNVITRNGNASVGSFSPHVPTGWSAYFSGYGTAQSISCTTNSSLNLDGDFTIEAWINYNTVANNRAILYLGSTAVTVGTGGTLGVTLVGSWDQLVAPSGSISAGRWFHVVVQRISNTLSSHINGVYQSSYTATRSNTLGGTGVNFLIGTNHDLVIPEGYITNVRIIKGQGIYGTSNFTPSTTPLENTANTSFLWRGGPLLRDESYNNFTLSKVATVVIAPFSPFKPHTVTPKSYSVYFDGTDDRLQVNYSTSPTISGDFTWETWVYDIGTTANGTLMGWRTAGGSWQGFIIQRNSGANNLSVNITNGGVTITQTSGTYIKNAWHHVALTRSGSTVTLWVNGASVGTATYSASISPGTSYWIGQDPQNVVSAAYLTGYISNQRFVNGTALYTSAFIPPTVPLTAVSGTGVLACQSSRIVDNSANAFAITVSGNSQPTKFNPFGETVTSGVEYSPAVHGGSMYFDGTTDVVYSTTSVPAIGTSTFTVDFWFYLKTYGTNKRLFALGVSGLDGIMIGRDSDSNILKVAISSSGSTTVLSSTSSSIVPVNQWTHLAVVRESTNTNQTKLYINGVLTLTGTSTASVSANPIQVGGLPPAWNTGYSIDGYISEPRLTVGSTLYTSNFVPPQAPPTPIPGTTFLLNGTNGAIQDSTGRNVLETVGNAQISTRVKKFGTGSLAFDGTGDYLVTADSLSWVLGSSGDFTIECWIYPNGTAAGTIATTWTSSLFANRWLLYLNGSNSILWHTDSGSTAINGGTVSASTWTHIAVVRSGSTITLYKNGTASGTQTSGQAFTTAGLLRIGGGIAGNGNDFNGYIDDLRITKGVARYTGNFTPPAAAHKLK